jgi:hypothetical protein
MSCGIVTASPDRTFVPGTLHVIARFLPFQLSRIDGFFFPVFLSACQSSVSTLGPKAKFYISAVDGEHKLKVDDLSAMSLSCEPAALTVAASNEARDDWRTC